MPVLAARCGVGREECQHRGMTVALASNARTAARVRFWEQDGSDYPHASAVRCGQADQPEYHSLGRLLAGDLAWGRRGPPVQIRPPPTQLGKLFRIRCRTWNAFAPHQVFQLRSPREPVQLGAEQPLGVRQERGNADVPAALEGRARFATGRCDRPDVPGAGFQGVSGMYGGRCDHPVRVVSVSRASSPSSSTCLSALVAAAGGRADHLRPGPVPPACNRGLRRLRTSGCWSARTPGSSGNACLGSTTGNCAEGSKSRPPFRSCL
jgi:hypothetical protein